MEEIKRSIDRLSEAIHATNNKIESVSDDVHLIKTTIIGIPEMKRPGLIDDVVKNTSDIAELRDAISNNNDKKSGDYKKKVFFTISGAAAGVAATKAGETPFWSKLITSIAALWR